MVLRFNGLSFWNMHLWTTVILEAGRKFSFEIKKHENPIVVWNYLSTIICLFYFLFPVISKFV